MANRTQLNRKARRAAAAKSRAGVPPPGMSPSHPRDNSSRGNPLAVLSRHILAKVTKNELIIDGEIGLKSLTGAKVREALGAMGKGDLNCTINSEGGGITEGVAIYHAIRKHDGKKVARVEGLAASMASVILQAFDERRMAAGSYLMIHNPQGGNAGESSDLRRTADLMDKMAEDLLDIYEARTGQPRDKIKAWMDAETYMTAEEAVENGFADVVDTNAKAMVTHRMVAALDKTSRKIPDALRAKLKGKIMDEEEEKALLAKLKALEEENAKLKASAEGDDEDEPKAEDDDSEGADDEGADDDKEEAKAVLAAARRITGKKSLSEVEGSLMALGAAASVGAASERAKEVKALVDAGKLRPADKAWALAASAKSFAAYKKGIGAGKILDIGGRTRPGKAPIDETELDGDGAPDPDALTAAEQAYQKASGKSSEEIKALRKVPKDNILRVVGSARPVAAKVGGSK